MALEISTVGEPWCREIAAFQESLPPPDQVPGFPENGGSFFPGYYSPFRHPIACWFFDICFLEITPENYRKKPTYPRFLGNYPRIGTKDPLTGRGRGQALRRRFAIGTVPGSQGDFALRITHGAFLKKGGPAIK